MTALADHIAAAFIAACLDELHAPKPGNVHVFADGHSMTADQFVRSAQAAAPLLVQAGARVGARILGAVHATSNAVGTNTNLGIILLCAPLAAAAQQFGDLDACIARVLDDLDVEDANLAFQAIAAASPGGLGRAERHDVHAPATVTLKQAMAAAADRDRIASQYARAFEDVLVIGEGTLATLPPGEPEWAALCVYLAFLAAFPDTHVRRKHGAATAEEVRQRAELFYDRARSTGDRVAVQKELLAWDRALKSKNINPGTSADLTVATLFLARLRHILPSARNNA